ncbi:hypothetical protein D9615_001555 [Tricholomella constricta]|uniref:Uncharacterized protein n=1 Tax=Tricholomella constricta TaxID=117010 RepID=A0A8H5HPM1_9AGAR|nr:hypothetical protein D9615_001555 [Tricholomella constricta]
MPSLRRTASSPSVRSSPYPALSSAVNGGLGSRGGGHRRSSGSETSTRRVLADIEWWRIIDGQCDTDADQESENRNRDQTIESPGLALQEFLESTGLFSGEMGAEHSAIVPLVIGSQESLQALPTNQFAALSISPHTLPRRQHVRESSASSLDSMPEAAEPASFEGLRLSILDTDLGFQEATLPTFPVLRRGAGVGCTGTAPPLFSLRAHSFTEFVSLKSDTAGHYADFTVSPLSSAAPHICN